jgi:hypothetical protein
MAGTLTPSTEEMVQLTALEVQIHFGDSNPKVHVEGFLTYVRGIMVERECVSVWECVREGESERRECEERRGEERRKRELWYVQENIYN